MSGKKFYVITGANRGIGFAITKNLSENSNNVVIATARNPEKSAELLELKSKNHNVHTVKLDVQSKESALAASEEVKKITGGVVDVLIANAGISDSYSTVLETSPEVYEEHWKTNFLGVVHTYQAFYPLMKNSSVKQIGIISSLAGSIGQFLPASISAYGSTKAAVNYLGRAIAFELKNEDFTVVCIHPGMVMSDMGKYGLETLKKNADPSELEYLNNNLRAITTKESGDAIVKVIDGLKKDDNDSFICYDGSLGVW